MCTIPALSEGCPSAQGGELCIGSIDIQEVASATRSAEQFDIATPRQSDVRTASPEVPEANADDLLEQVHYALTLEYMLNSDEAEVSELPPQPVHEDDEAGPGVQETVPAQMPECDVPIRTPMDVADPLSQAARGVQLPTPI